MAKQKYDYEVVATGCNILNNVEDHLGITIAQAEDERWARHIVALLNADAAQQAAPAADPWPEVPKEMDLWSWRGPEYAYGGPDHDETRRTINALIACVDDLQRRLGKEEKR